MLLDRVDREHCDIRSHFGNHNANTRQIQNSDIPRTVEADQQRRRGGAEWDWAGRNADGSVRPEDNHPSCDPGHRIQLLEHLLKSKSK